MIRPENLVGRRLLQVTTSWHHSPETEPSLIHMWLHVDGLGPVRFHTSGSGGLALEVDQPHDPYDMDEYGRTTVEGDVRDFPMSPFIGQQILAIRKIHYRDGNVDFAIGIGMQFTGGTVRVLNLADDLILAHEQHLGAVEKYLHEAAISNTALPSAP